ncbi:hypothetical protein SAMN05444398_10154 [Roseovarius pacificus]|uniref:Uncharacterized protein n=1 Tax=Roseovarius pacificus TaxID=337701 RepID=A0A1M6WKE3_9RHOB|nr:hypothetical protein [Roseovarius pacificus]GGO53209.1 hypothetical protein GCM10011315_10570 [Roseovarius pacificus]SHK94242.1 hypothetical protein SAMN05444398_10154 [Roseovarius pacificus]
MTVTSAAKLNAYATIAKQTYYDFAPYDIEPTPTVAGLNGSLYTEITQIVNGPLGFQARAFFNETTNELVIAFTGTEGADDLDVKAWRCAT